MVSWTIRTARSLSSAGCWCPDPCLGVCCFDAAMGYILPKNAASIKPRAGHGIDHKYAGRRDHDVVDIAASAANPAVVQHHKAIDSGQSLSELLFADRTTLPCPSGLGFSGQSQGDSANQ